MQRPPSGSKKSTKALVNSFSTGNATAQPASNFGAGIPQCFPNCSDPLTKPGPANVFRAVCCFPGTFRHAGSPGPVVFFTIPPGCIAFSTITATGEGSERQFRTRKPGEG